LLAVAVAVAVTGCGGADKFSPPPSPKPPVATSHGPQIVSMRRVDGATWETVVVRADGTVDVGVFIGEWTGTHHHQFRVAAGQLGRLKRLVVNAARSRQPPGWGSSTPPAVYYIFAGQRFLETAQGYVPRRLTALVGILNGMIDRYAV
jgi:hypothetical protein